jgi:hypothetical protein
LHADVHINHDQTPPLGGVFASCWLNGGFWPLAAPPQRATAIFSPEWRAFRGLGKDAHR